MQPSELSVSTLKQWQDENKYFHLLDVRTEGEMQQAMIPGGKPLAVHKIGEEIHLYSPEDTLVIYCRSGFRSAQVCEFFTQHGFTSIFNLAGGIIDWYDRGFPVTTLRELQAPIISKQIA